MEAVFSGEPSSASSAVPDVAYDVLRRGTGNFSSARQIGSGGFGCVYSLDLDGAGRARHALKIMHTGGKLKKSTVKRAYKTELAVSRSVGHNAHVIQVVGKVCDKMQAGPPASTHFAPLCGCSRAANTCLLS